MAAACCYSLLTFQGTPVHWSSSRRVPVPAIMLSDAALALLRDCLGQPNLFADNRRITRRIVVWGGPDPVALPHAAAMLGAGDLDFPPPPEDGSPAASAFTIHTAAVPNSKAQLHFGDRAGEVVPVDLLHPEDSDACWIEATGAGWLFMIPCAADSGWLLAIGAPVDELMGQSKHLTERVRFTASQAVQFDTTPRMQLPMAQQSWLACGSPSMAFDPICGDGTATAAKQAILASAVAQAMLEGEHAEELAGHYQAMMVASMRRHLRLCAEFYASGGDSAWWHSQQQALAEGFAQCSALLEREPAPRFALDGYRLVRRELAE